MLKYIKSLGLLQAIFVLGLMSFSTNSVLAADAGNVKVKKEPKPMKMGTQNALSKGPAAVIGKKGPGEPMKKGTQSAPPKGPAAKIGKPPVAQPGAIPAGAPGAGANEGVNGVPPKKQSFMGKMAADRQASKTAKAQRNAALTPEQQLRKDEMRMQNRQLAGGIAMGMTGAAAGLAGQRMAQKHDSKMMNQQQQQMNQQGQMPQQQMMQQPQMQGQMQQPMQPQQQQMMQQPMQGQQQLPQGGIPQQ